MSRSSLFHGPKKVAIEVSKEENASPEASPIRVAPPQIPKPPPPMIPSTLENGRREKKGEAKGMECQDKGKPKGKKGAWIHNKGGSLYRKSKKIEKGKASIRATQQERSTGES